MDRIVPSPDGPCYCDGGPECVIRPVEPEDDECDASWMNAPKVNETVMTQLMGRPVKFGTSLSYILL